MTAVVVTFPGSNCDRDCVWALSLLSGPVGVSVTRAWHQDAELPAGTSSVVLPGGFSHGDYLRCGAMAATSPIMAAVRRFAHNGGPVLGICNGFQILCESRLLPGALLRNRDGAFVCEEVELDVVGGGSNLLSGFDKHARIRLPVAHGEGNYFADDATLDALERDGRIALTYVERDENGDGGCNGARRGIAGIIGGDQRNILGLMPHPERRAASALGGEDGLALLRGLVQFGRTRGA